MSALKVAALFGLAIVGGAAAGAASEAVGIAMIWFLQ